MARIICFGEMLLRLSSPARERLFQAGSLDTNFVGAEANVGVTLSRMGNDVSMITVLPDNAVGNACCDTLHEQNIDTSNIIRQGERMAIYFLETGAMIRPSAITYDRKYSAFAQASEKDFDWKTLLSGAGWLHLSGITLAVSEGAQKASLEAAKIARKMGVKISFDCNYRPSLWTGREDEGVKIIKDVAAHADLIFGGDKDVQLLFGITRNADNPAESFQRAAQEFFEQCPHLETVCSTNRTVLSADSNKLAGFIATKDSFAQTKAWDLFNIVDRIGGGDAFAGGALHKIAAGAPPQEIIDFAVATSAIKHTIPGDFNITSEAEVNALLSSSGGDVKR
ncbi:sugar kinase [Hirschia maritima]|uniref:sugar kinase n=1 Tax=Hirschia maritima TaxID=1121961 RepID=UPI0003A6FFA0|nr:sugar kinase [Hirschia maritima]